MGANGFLAYPPTVYFPNIDFNNDFYSIPNNGQGITLDYANTHFLFSTGNATSSASTTFFSGSMGVGAPPSGVNGNITALTVNATTNLQENGTNLSSKYLQLIGGTLTGILNAPQYKEDGNFLSNIYVSSNSLYNQLYTLNYTVIRQYPPKLYDSVNTESTITFLGQSVIYQTITINNYTNGYGIGSYNI